MASLAPALRKKLEDAVKEARDVAEAGARAALEQLAVHAAEPFAHLSPEDRELRNRLRARARQLGDARDAKTGAHQIDHLVVECAYEHWHRMLFARFLAENGVLMANSEALGIENTPVTLEECEELAADEGAANGWELAGRYASRMLPQIFRPDAPVLAVHLPPERQRRLEQILAELSPETFKASDALGWVYQFWQAKKKDEVNASGVKIGADELPAVTQLFTEPYMVEFLLHNTLGAWWAGKVLAERPEIAIAAKSEEELRAACAIPHCSWAALRFVRHANGVWCPAAGSFEQWPRSTRELKTLDPCCGSGHFLVAALEIVVGLLTAESPSMSNADAVRHAMSENIHGLEIDPRCAEIAAFAVWLTARRTSGPAGAHIPSPRIACVGVAPRATLDEWLAPAAESDTELRRALTELHATFVDAPLLGSLIDPRRFGTTDGTQRRLGGTNWSQSRNAVFAALQRSESLGDAITRERAVAARGMLDALSLLDGQYHLVATNPPYLVKGKQGPRLQQLLHSYCSTGDADMATVFIRRCSSFAAHGGTHATVTPQNWLYLSSYKDFRSELLRSETVSLVARIGSGATSVASWDVLRALTVSTTTAPTDASMMCGVDAQSAIESERARDVLENPLQASVQVDLYRTPDRRLVAGYSPGAAVLGDVAQAYQGIKTGDDGRLRRFFWEVPRVGDRWRPLLSTTPKIQPFGGMESVVDWVDDGSRMARRQGVAAWGKPGVAASQMRSLPCVLYSGELFDSNVSAIVPEDPDLVPAIWAFCSSSEFNAEVRRIDQSLAVTNGALARVAFDRERWESVAASRFSGGLPAPVCTDPTQWIFTGAPASSEQALLVGAARLCGFEWPGKGDGDLLGGMSDDDGIVCLPSVRGEEAAAERLVGILAAAFGDQWSTARRDSLLVAVGAQGKGLKWWLQNKFFEQHCQLFQHRPFIWHIWDGIKKDGFGALVNYHKLDRKLLETLTYTYLGDWIRGQQDDAARNVDGASERLDAARRLQQNLELILEGEKPHDIFVRWKPLREQPIGWEPDLNDGVRVNIRPFMSVPDVDKKGAGVLRYKPNIHWKKDRGTDPDDAPWFELGPSYGEAKGARINDHHLSLVEKRAARERAGGAK